MFLVILTIALLLVALVLGVILTESEKFGVATLSMLGVVILLQLFHVADIWTFMHEHLVLSLKYTALYFAFGVGWSFAKWFIFLNAFKEDYLKAKRGWMVDHGILVGSELTADQQAAMLKDLRGRFGFYYRGDNVLGTIPQAVDNKKRITAWIGLWVFSFLGWLFNDPVTKLVNGIFVVFRGAYQRMSNYVFRDLKELK